MNHYATVPNPRDPKYRSAVRAVTERLEEIDDERREEAAVDEDLETAEAEWLKRHPRSGTTAFDDLDRSPRTRRAIASVAERLGTLDEAAMDEEALRSFDADTPEEAAKRVRKAIRSVSGEEATDEEELAAEGNVVDEEELDEEPEPEDKPPASPDDYAAYDAEAAETFPSTPEPTRRAARSRPVDDGFENEGEGDWLRRSSTPPVFHPR